MLGQLEQNGKGGPGRSVGARRRPGKSTRVARARALGTPRQKGKGGPGKSIRAARARALGPRLKLLGGMGKVSEVRLDLFRLG